MKKFKNLKYVAIIGLLMVFNSCSNESDLEFIEESIQLESDQNLQTKNNQAPSIDVIIEYEFTPWSTDEEQDVFRAALRYDRSADFTIYDTVWGNRNCGTVEKWTVNEVEFDNYLNLLSPPNIQLPSGGNVNIILPDGGGTTNASTGTASIKVVRRPTGGIVDGGNNDDIYTGCFTSSFPF